MTFFAVLREAVSEDWSLYTRHRFVERLGAGTLATDAFRDYLAQDYLFLVHFARAHALAAYKSTCIDDIAHAARALQTTLAETGLHLAFAEQWGIPPERLRTVPEKPATTAYTRYVLDTAARGDLLDLHVVLAPCTIGYAEIGLALSEALDRDDHPYRAWIADYAGDEYQAVAQAAIVRLDVLADRALTPYRRAELIETFRSAVRLEAAFWEQSADL